VPVLSLTAPGTEDIAFECFAVTEGVVAATGVESCYLKNSATGVTVASSLPNWLPGNVTTERGSSNQPVAGYSLCVQVGFFTLGGAKFLGAVNCYPV
jgi:hypothetical protein